ncbi:MAG TPA: glycoside hydrolase family 9 protein [Polyangiaceae bacterium]|nr:glycoside hydrolase family 9 protein [Polyangiaceae bacterium]
MEPRRSPRSPLLLAILAGCAASTPSLSPKASHNLVGNATFEGGKILPWTTSFTAPAAGQAAIKDGEFCVEVTDKGAANWDAQFRHREMTIRKGHRYFMRFRARSTQPTSIRPKVGMAGPPYREYFWQEIDITASPRLFEYEFTMQHDDDATAELAFHIGGDLARNVKPPYTVCVDNVELDDPQFTAGPSEKAAPIAAVRVNQVGYFPSLVKIASIRREGAPVTWELHDGTGAVVDSGKTTAFGKDAASGETLHLADFSTYAKSGSGYTLKVASDESHRFDIAENLYAGLKYRALSYFYHNRSGIEIVLPHATEKAWTRPAGHLADKRVSFEPSSGRSYTLDVSGGWYDAGDHGKYVVNGGIAVWTLLNQFERAKILGSSSSEFGDGTMNIPESHNGVPDLLDEARWELEFLLKMQVPEGQPLAGMAHHKVHDRDWTALGMRPDEDKMARTLRAPSTAATLNLAATAAQAARLFKTSDAAFARTCLVAAEKAWKAAQAHPDLFALATDSKGGGPYDDKHVDDEFYWAAAELFITTGDTAYRDFLSRSPHYKQVPSSLSEEGGISGAMTWQSTQALGSISLAIVPNGLAPAEVAAMRSNLVATADTFLQTISTQGHRVPFQPGPKGEYPWGSNSFVLNNAVVLALAHDLTKNVKYLNGVVQAMDYILGRNPLDQSYITGFGARPLQNPHHRFWSYQVNHAFPKPPPGAVSGGPNSGLQDPYGRAAGLLGCVPQKCWIDNIEAWAANEITINWNAPLAWVAAYLDEMARRPGSKEK